MKRNKMYGVDSFQMLTTLSIGQAWFKSKIYKDSRICKYIKNEELFSVLKLASPTATSEPSVRSQPAEYGRWAKSTLVRTLLIICSVTLVPSRRPVKNFTFSDAAENVVIYTFFMVNFELECLVLM